MFVIIIEQSISRNPAINLELLMAGDLQHINSKYPFSYHEKGQIAVGER